MADGIFRSQWRECSTRGINTGSMTNPGFSFGTSSQGEGVLDHNVLLRHAERSDASSDAKALEDRSSEALLCSLSFERHAFQSSKSFGGHALQNS